MLVGPKSNRAMPLGVVMRRSPGVTRWAKWSWKATAILPGAGQATWRELRREGDVVEYHAATRMLELFAAETEAYVHGLAARIPGIYVVMRRVAGEFPLDIVLVTASPFEAQDYADSSEDIVEKVPMSPGLITWVGEFLDEFHETESFVKRQRDSERVDLWQDGLGDPRIGKAADIYASPGLIRSRLQ